MTDGFQSPEAGDKLPETVNLTSLKGLKLWGDLNSAEIACKLIGEFIVSGVLSFGSG